MTFGMDVGWRRRAVRELRLPGGALVADLACGTGDLCRELQRNGYRAAGFDFSLGMLERARTDAPLVEEDVLRCAGDGAWTAHVRLRHSTAW
jgi:demethylmenaquinone methyltransferase/2-methoxy-6-polyprenyl-1,4-benzoquinol methylase